MPTSTSFLSLTLPELNEFVDSWNTVINGNNEILDDWLADLYASLVTASTTSIWQPLRGSKVSLAARLDVSINADGTIKLTGSDDYNDMAVSAVRGTNVDGPPGRMNEGDFEVYAARQPVADGRFVPMGESGPSAGFPPEDIDSGIALRSADFSRDTNHPMASPKIPWSPGLVEGGAVPLISAQATGTVRFDASTIPAIFNIDGYIFRIREIIDFDWTLLAPGIGDYVWIYVERNELNYLINDGVNFKYDGVGGSGTAVKDLRKLQAGTLGVTSNSAFSDTGALFNTKPLGKAKEGDVLVIESGSAAGSYVIEAPSSDTAVNIKGTFKANVSGVTWHILDNNHPNIGAVVTDSLKTTQPPAADGRVYIGRARNQAGNPDEVIVFTRGGVHDSGWQDAATLVGGTPRVVTHNLGQVPSQVEIWVRESAVGRVYQPMVERQVVTEMNPANFPDPLAADTSTTLKLLFPSLRSHTSSEDTTVILTNATIDPAKPAALFTDSSGTDKTVGQIRVISRL